MNETWYTTETDNGSKVRIKEWITPGTAWTQGTKHSIFFIELSNKDLEIQKSLPLPNWRWDFTGKGLTLEKGKMDYGVTKMHFDNLNIKTPWIRD
jgi:hypothetical protein